MFVIPRTGSAWRSVLNWWRWFDADLRCLALAAALALLPAVAFSQGKTAPKDAKLYFITPHDGQKVRGGFWVRFGLRNMGVTHAGDDNQNAGHHYLLIDVNDPVDPKEPILQDKSHLHFGAGQTKTLLELPPGTHTLQLVLGDAKHSPFEPPIVSEKITIRMRPSEVIVSTVRCPFLPCRYRPPLQRGLS